MIKKENKRIIITLSKEDIDLLDKINSTFGKKTYTQAIRFLISFYKSFK